MYTETTSTTDVMPVVTVPSTEGFLRKVGCDSCEGETKDNAMARLLTNANCSIKRFIRIVDCNPLSYENWKHGVSVPQKRWVCLIAKALNMDEDALFKIQARAWADSHNEYVTTKKEAVSKATVDVVESAHHKHGTPFADLIDMAEFVSVLSEPELELVLDMRRFMLRATQERK